MFAWVLPCYSDEDESVMMVEAPEDDESSGISKCTSLQKSYSSSFERGSSVSDVDKEDSQHSAVLFLYDPARQRL